MPADPVSGPLRIIEPPPPSAAQVLRQSGVALLGYGNQGAAHALNLRDSGVPVMVGARSGPGAERARSSGFEVREIEAAAAASGLVILALPDELHAKHWPAIAAAMRPDAVAGVLHGASMHFGWIRPAAEIGVVMVAPKGPGATLRARFEAGQGIPSLFGVAQPGRDPERTRTLGLAWAEAIGSFRAAVIETTVAAECETDLFGEQSVLCGGLSALIEAAFDTLVAAGYPPELAYIECCHEVKQVADLIYLHGPAGMQRRISNTAEYGALRAAPVVVDDALRARLRDLLASIRDGSFARAFREDAERGLPALDASRARAERHPIEDAGRRVRALMPWLVDEARRS